MFRTSSVHHQERFVQAVFADLVCGTTVRTTRHVQPLLRNGWTCRVVIVFPHTFYSSWWDYSLSFLCFTFLRPPKYFESCILTQHAKSQTCSCISDLHIGGWRTQETKWCLFLLPPGLVEEQSTDKKSECHVVPQDPSFFNLQKIAEGTKHTLIQARLARWLIGMAWCC